MDLRFPCDEHDIPMLRLDRQAVGMDLPLLPWGESRGRGARNCGTYHFYVHDKHFRTIWDKPQRLLNTGCIGVIETNFSIFPQTPLPLALWLTYQKRWLSRFWQEKGVTVWADLNVAPNYAELNLVGVPKGWKTYATRGYAERLSSIDDEYQIAATHCGSAPTFVVYGGGQATEAYCRERGYTYFAEDYRERGRDKLRALERKAKAHQGQTQLEALTAN